MKRKGFFWTKVLINAVLFCLLFNISAILAKNDLILPGVPEVDLYNKNNLDVYTTIAELKAKIEEDPGNYEYYSMLAFTYDYIGMDKESLEALKKELECYPGPDWHTLYYNIARAYMNMGQLEEGKVYLDKAMDYRPDDIYNNGLLLDYSILIKDYSQAAIQMKKLADMFPEKDWYHDAFTKFFDVEDKDAYDFLALYTKALELNPNNHYAIRSYALMLRNQGKEQFLENYDFIIKELKRAYRLKPNYAFHCVGIGNTYLWKWVLDKNKKNLRQALSWMKKAQKLEPENPQVVYCLGHLYIYMQEEDKAIELLEKAITLGMDDDETVKKVLAQAYNGKAYSCYKKDENLDVGMQCIEKALIFDPEDGIILSTKAELLYKMGRYEEAHECIKRALVLDPGHEEMLQDLENIEKAMGENK
ncbi:MAG: tetratricopeptide repeat protein [Candidatus Omnitrophota bacterium]